MKNRRPASLRASRLMFLRPFGWFCTAAAIGLPCLADGAGRAAARGALIYRGDAALPAHLRGHEEGLPAAVAKCVNCHANGRSQAGFAPPLTPASLRMPQPRRGGPESAYDAAAFCRVLRTGIDPMQIVLARSMPRFEVSDADCLALWAFLAQPEGSPSDD
jgi:hypothetical protein